MIMPYRMISDSLVMATALCFGPDLSKYFTEVSKYFTLPQANTIHKTLHICILHQWHIF